ncbi:MAG: hypothetical protein ABR552_04900 [Actinomycetota bacterium]
MKKPRKWLVALIATTNVVIGGWAGYGLYTRAGPLVFARGGEFGVIQTPTTSPSATATATGARVAGKAVLRRGAPSGGGGGKTTSSARSSAFTFPNEGTYHYTGTGHEQVHYSFAPACSWDIGSVTAIISHRGNELTADWTFSSERHERHIDELRGDGLYRTFVGAAVVCAGVEKKSNADYTPPALTVPWPLRTGFTRHQDCTTQDRLEAIDVRVLSHQLLAVPAGRFDTYRIEIAGAMSGGQTGNYTVNLWFAPSLGTVVRQTETLDAHQGDAHFESHFDIKLVSTP